MFDTVVLYICLCYKSPKIPVGAHAKYHGFGIGSGILRLLARCMGGDSSANEGGVKCQKSSSMVPGKSCEAQWGLVPAISCAGKAVRASGLVCTSSMTVCV